MAEEEEHSSALEVTPTWAVATVCFVLIFISIFLEHLLHLVAKYLHRTKRKSLLQALDNIKSELMMLGFLSLLLTAGEKPISSICIPIRVSETFLPCPRVESSEEEEETTCQSQGKMSLMSQEGVRQLNYLIFVFALFHCLSCIFTFGLGMAKMRKWASWEAETKTLEYHFSNDPRRFRLAHQTSFAKRHLTCWTDQWMLRGPAIFLRQFYKSVSRVDYLTLRHGFITTHLSEGSKFDFQKYIERALEKDFGVVVGMSLWVWMFSIIFIFFHAHGFYNYVWLPFFPLVMLLCVGTKLQGIITKMGLESRDKSHVVRGRLVVRPSDHFFWFGRPKLILYLIHFILFQNSFQLAFFIWTWYKFGFKSCFHQTVDDIVIRLVMGVLVQILCGYVTLPLYALVTQMGSSMRDAVFTQNVTQGLKKWRATAKKNLAQKKQNSASRSHDPSRNTSSPASILHGCRASSMAVELHPSSDQQFIQIKMEGDEDTRQQQDNKTSTG